MPDDTELTIDNRAQPVSIWECFYCGSEIHIPGAHDATCPVKVLGDIIDILNAQGGAQ